MNRILFKLFLLAFGATAQLQALGLGGAIGQETLNMGLRKKGGSGDLNYQTLDVKFTTMKFTLLDIGKPLATGLYNRDAEGSFWYRQAKVETKAKDTQWLGSSTTLSYIMGSSSDAEQVLTVGGPSTTPKSSNSMWGIDLDLGLGQWQFLKLPLEINLNYDAQFRNYVITGVYDGATSKTGETGGMSVNGFLGLGADLGIIPGLVLSVGAGYDPIFSAMAALYPEFMSQGYRFYGGAEFQPLAFLSGFVHWEQQTTGFVGLSRPTTMTDVTFGGRFYFY